MVEESKKKTQDTPVEAKQPEVATAKPDAPAQEKKEERSARPERPTRPVRNARPQRGRGGKPFYAKKVCRFCTKQIDEKDIDYKNIDLMRRYVMPSGKIVPRRINGNCAKHQRRVSAEIKKDRLLALLPFMDR